jgi:acetyltransferase-like isoleucine patch superfamily enzyme
MKTVELAEITGAWDYKSLPDNVEIGDGCFLERKHSLDRFRSTRQPGLKLGRNVRAYTWTQFNVEPCGRLVIGSDSVLVGAVFMCADAITIGCRVVISYNVTIADCDFHPHDPEERMQDAIANAPLGDRSLRPKIVTQPVVIEDDVWVGIGAMVLKGVHIGQGARIAAGTIVTKSVPAYATVSGNPARIEAAEDRNP